MTMGCNEMGPYRPAELTPNEKVVLRRVVGVAELQPGPYLLVHIGVARDRGREQNASPARGEPSG